MRKAGYCGNNENTMNWGEERAVQNELWQAGHHQVNGIAWDHQQMQDCVLNLFHVHILPGCLHCLLMIFLRRVFQARFHLMLLPKRY